MKVAIFVESARVGIFFEFLSAGFPVKTSVGVSVREFLCNGLKIDPEYVDTVIQTIFLNGRALDDIDHAMLTDGSVLALSGAMPGLAGAIFRRGGAYASLRSNVAAAPSQFRKQPTEGIVMVKLFNQVAADLGPSFFKKGIRIKGSMLSDFFYRNREKLEMIHPVVEVEEKKYPIDRFPENEFVSEEICLTIEPI
jgi:hypothetical protein